MTYVGIYLNHIYIYIYIYVCVYMHTCMTIYNMIVPYITINKLYTLVSVLDIS